MKLEEFLIAANDDHNSLITNGQTDNQLLEEFLFLHKRIAYFERRYELLKHVILDKDIKGEFEDLYLGRHKTVSYEYDENEELYQKLVKQETEVKQLKVDLKALSTTKKITKTTTGVKQSNK